MNRRDAYKLTITAILLAILALPSFARAQSLMDSIGKELEFTEALIRKGSDLGDIKQYQTAHRTLANLAVTADKLENPRDVVLTRLSIAYFYIRMCADLPLLEISKTTNPEGLSIDCAAESEKHIAAALDMADKNLKGADVADTHFYAGIGYDALRGYLAKIPGRDTREYFSKAFSEIKTAVFIGASFDGAKTVLARFSGADPAGGKPVIPPDTFILLHRMLYMQRVFTPPSSLGIIAGGSNSGTTPADVKNTYIDYQWRFSIHKPDSNWEFATSTTHTNFRITIKKKAGTPDARPPLTLVAHELAPDEAAMTLKALVERSTALLLQAGYVIESQSEMNFKDKPAYEIILASSYKDLGIKGGETDKPAAPGVVTRNYMFVVLANGIEYILSFNTLVADYPKVFPEIKLIANTLDLF